MRKHAAPGDRRLPLGLQILHEDRDIIVVDKPAGLLTMGTDRDKERTAYYVLTDYVRKGTAKSRNRVFIVHRLDRETSGVLVFARTEQAKFTLQEHWDETEKKYLAVVHGHPRQESDMIESYLVESGPNLVHTTRDPNRGKLARTAYKVLKATPEFSLLEVELLTGRKHQIRVHFADLGHPIVGDKKYGKKDPAHSRLALHALSLTLNHPYNGERLTFTAPVPGHFPSLVGRITLPSASPPEPQA